MTVIQGILLALSIAVFVYLGVALFKAEFMGLLIGVIMIVGVLTFFPAVSPGPIVEQLSHGKFF